MDSVQVYAAGNTIVIWCAKCQHTIRRMSDMHSLSSINDNATTHKCPPLEEINS